MEDSDCMLCHEDKTLTKTNAQGQAIWLFVDAAILQGSVHRTNSCAGCHSDLTDKHPDDNVPAKPVDCTVCHKEQSESYGASVHGVALAGGDAGSASCKDCHGNHRVLPHTDPASPLHFRNLTKTCGECHDDVAREVEASVHGQAVTAGEREAATCTDCHCEHSIQKLQGTASLRISADMFFTSS